MFNIARAKIIPSLLIDAAWKTAIGRHDNTSNSFLKAGVFLIAKYTIPEYNNKLQSLPNHNANITGNSNIFAINIPNPWAK